MIITTVMSVPVSYKDKDGKVKQVALKPGSHSYPMLNHKDPMVAEQLRIFQKHGRIGFDEILAVEKPELKEPEVVETPEEIAGPVEDAEPKATKRGRRRKISE